MSTMRVIMIRLVRILGFFALAALGGVLFSYFASKGEAWAHLTLVMLTLGFIGSLLLLTELIALAGSLTGRNWQLRNSTNLILVFCSVMLCLLAFETLLWIHPAGNAAADETGKKPVPLAIPDELQRRDVTVEGARVAYIWHGKLHVHDENSIRRTTPFPPKRDDTFRIMVVGDSLTYGYGVAEEKVYAKVLEHRLAEKYRVEAFNLGVTGHASSDILGMIERFAPQLKPDLIIYGICLNDFLDSGVGQYLNNMRYQFPLPDPFKNLMQRGTRLGKFLEHNYDQLLLRLKLRRDFFDDILYNLHNCRGRFAGDLKAMNAFSTKNGFGRVIAMVLDQYPVYGGRGHQLAKIAEGAVTDAGMIAVPTEPYYKTFHGGVFHVSPWEGHPSEEAHQIFAEMLLPEVRKVAALEKYRRASDRSRPYASHASTICFQSP